MAANDSPRTPGGKARAARKQPRLQMVGFHPKPDLFHIGRKAPAGYEETGPSIHLGRGIWILPLRLKK